MNDEEFAALEFEVERLWEFTKSAEEASHLATRTWSARHQLLADERLRRNVRAEILAEQAAESGGLRIEDRFDARVRHMLDEVEMRPSQREAAVEKLANELREACAAEADE
jgi:hypothetical protein